MKRLGMLKVYYYMLVAVSLLFSRSVSPLPGVNYCRAVDASWCCRSTYWLMNTTANVCKEAAFLHRALFCEDTIKLLLIAGPFYAVSLVADTTIHSYFYDERHHKNIKQLHPRTIREISALSHRGIFLFAALGLLYPNDHVRRVARIFFTGYISMIFVKTILKGFEWKPAIRPYTQKFERTIAHGGFPSGHMAQATYLATALGLEYGFKVGIPLSFLAVVMGGVLVGSNRHYVSQIIAGGTLGIAYGMAAHKLTYINEKYSFLYGLHYENNRVVASVGYAF